jgi:hypothetical protein
MLNGFFMVREWPGSMGMDVDISKVHGKNHSQATCFYLKLAVWITGLYFSTIFA